MKFPMTHPEQGKENHVKGLKRPSITKGASNPVKVRQGGESRRLSKVDRVDSPYCGIKST